MSKENTFANYVFRVAKLSDLKLIMQFIKKNWDNKHILGIDQNYFKYQFVYKDKLNFILAVNKKKKIIEAIHGFIAYSSGKNKTICGSIVCVDKNSLTPFLGIEIMRRIKSLVPHKIYLGIGTNPNSMIPIAKKIFKRYTGKMKHYYILNSNFKKFNIASINDTKKKNFKNFNKGYGLKPIKNILELKKNYKNILRFKNFPYKSITYLKKRYFEHPIYKYRLYSIINNSGKINSLIISRELTHKSNKILSIVDFIGSEKDLSKIGNALEKIIIKGNYEYIDMLCTNFQEEFLFKSNFRLKKKNDKNIIPLYFQPFVRKNVQIWYESSIKNLRLFKGDADQDTPRVVKK
tara:strand:- start:3768 stop:4811 length:1044 start_codon:yes stop_codon:yes gene_type:complete